MELQSIRQLVANSKVFPLPDYDLDLVGGRSSQLLRMRYRVEGASVLKAETAALPMPR